eukprot:TRINITY_DN7515_c1_g1_i1.p1 TRINITY_DN7515_c1_g1~~TRINITY_DN7515_c1_g1_i1.p1  ORF type:complete len:349 (+),score=123.31 TRINITY_DN7515_c1_g1_i1:43-1089(+)
MPKEGQSIESTDKDDRIELERKRLKISEAFWPPNWREIDNESLKSYISKGILGLQSTDDNIVRMSLEVVYFTSKSKRISEILKENVVPKLHSVIVLGRRLNDIQLIRDSMKVYENLLQNRVEPLNYLKMAVGDCVESASGSNGNDLETISLGLWCLSQLLDFYEEYLRKEKGSVQKILRRNEQELLSSSILLLNSNFRDRLDTCATFYSALGSSPFLSQLGYFPSWEQAIIKSGFLRSMKTKAKELSGKEEKGFFFLLNILCTFPQGFRQIQDNLMDDLNHLMRKNTSELSEDFQSKWAEICKEFSMENLLSVQLEEKESVANKTIFVAGAALTAVIGFVLWKKINSN